MKNLTTTVCMVLLTLFAVTSYAQQNRLAVKPSLFADLPQVIHFTAPQLNALFEKAEGQNIDLPLGSLIVSGLVTSNLVKYQNLQTIVIKLPGLKNTLLSLSKQKGVDKKITYVGRIINPLYNDGFELKPATAGNYKLVKISTDKLLVDCNR